MSLRKFEYFFLALICVLAGAELLSSHPWLFGASFAASRRAQLSQTAAQPSPLQPPADLVLTNGKIYTGLAAQPWASAVAIRGEFVVAISGVAIGGAGADSDAQIKSWLGPKTRVIDLHGQFAMPGFNDAHVHLAAGAYVKLEVDLRGTKSVEEFQQRIRARLKEFGPGEWIIAPGWDHTLWPVKKFPSRQDLDAISTEHPIFLTARGWPRGRGEFASAQDRRHHSRYARSTGRAHRARSGQRASRPECWKKMRR